ncbi:serine hydrolase, partial [Cyanobacterium stanieri LEGE 03274]|nr:serine hydrolase [Cyanobacterium stanieri LEGE 03274]
MAKYQSKSKVNKFQSKSSSSKIKKDISAPSTSSVTPFPSQKVMTYSPSKSKPPESMVNVIINNIFRLAIVGIGLGTIFGSVLANVDLTKPLFPKVNLPFFNNPTPENNSSAVTPAPN